MRGRNCVSLHLDGHALIDLQLSVIRAGDSHVSSAYFEDSVIKNGSNYSGQSSRLMELFTAVTHCCLDTNRNMCRHRWWGKHHEATKD